MSDNPELKAHQIGRWKDDDSIEIHPMLLLGTKYSTNKRTGNPEVNTTPYSSDTPVSLVHHPEKKLVRIDTLNVTKEHRGLGSRIVASVVKHTPSDHKIVLTDESKGFWNKMSKKYPDRFIIDNEESK
jgi:hypothetical protein